MLNLASPPPYFPRLKGASGHIFRILRECTVDGRCIISLDALSVLSGYCTPTVQSAIRDLQARNLIDITKQYGDRRNCYRLR